MYGVKTRTELYGTKKPGIFMVYNPKYPGIGHYYVRFPEPQEELQAPDDPFHNSTTNPALLEYIDPVDVLTNLAHDPTTPAVAEARQKQNEVIAENPLPPGSLQNIKPVVVP